MILDTSVLIAAERSRVPLESLLVADDDVAIAAITAAELRLGVALSTGRRRAHRRTLVEDVLAQIPAEPYDLTVARAHAGLLADVRRSGRQRGAHDLVIAATAVARGRIVVSTDSRGFEGLPGVALRRLT